MKTREQLIELMADVRHKETKANRLLSAASARASDKAWRKLADAILDVPLTNEELDTITG